MKLLLKIILLFLVTSRLYGQSVDKVQLKVNWSTYLTNYNLKWDKLPVDYFDGAFAGNGLLGTIVFKDNLDSNSLRFEIGRTDVYDHRTPTSSAYETSRLPIGQLILKPTGEILKSHFEIDLWNAQIRGEIITKTGTIQIKCYVPAQEELIVLDLKCTGGEKNPSIKFRPQAAESARYLAKKPIGGEKGGYNYLFNPPFTTDHSKGVEVVTQTLLMGDDYATVWAKKKLNNGNLQVLLTVANRWGKYRKPMQGSAEDALQTILAGQQKNWKKVERLHQNWWHNYYPKSFVSIPDTKLESFYWIQMYKLASATQPGKPVIDLLGPWFKDTSWPLLWMNLNVQLTYNTLGITNHLDLERNLYDLLDRHQDQLIKNVPLAFQNDCAAIRNPVQFDDLNAPLFLSDDPQNKEEINIIVLPWLMQMYYLHNTREMDDEKLKNNIYPLMRRAFNVYLRIMHLENDGLYHIPYTYSDEYGNAPETSLNIALAKWGFKTLLQITRRLKIDDPLIPRWEETLLKMAPYQTNENGIMIGKNMPFSKPHRHFSHLFTIFPLYETTIEKSPEKLPLFQKSIQHFTDLDGDNCMYKFSGASSLWSSIGEGNKALFWLDRSLDLLRRFAAPPAPSRTPTVTSNTFYSERENPTFESPIASSRAILDMLIQDHDQLIRVFPACPENWENAAFHDLRTAGAFLVSAKKENSLLKFIRIKSLAGEVCQIKNNFTGPIQVIGIPKNNWKIVDGIIQLTISKGEEAFIYSGQKPENFIINPVNSNASFYWGSQVLPKLN